MHQEDQTGQSIDQASGWTWFVEHEAYTLATITLAAYLIFTGSNLAYLSTLGVPSSGLVSLPSYVWTLPRVGLLAVLCFLVLKLYMWLIKAHNWQAWISGKIAIMVFTVLTLFFVGQPSMLRSWGLGATTIKLLTLFFLIALIARFIVLVDKRRFAPLTYVLLMFSFWFFGVSFGYEAAVTQEKWRVVEISGGNASYVVLDERGDRLIVAPLLDPQNGLYESRILYLDLGTEGLSESVQAIGPITSQE